VKYINLQILRGFSAVSIVLFHISSYTNIPIFGIAFSGAVFIFFGISGFLMASMVDTNYPNFLPMRFVRIYPAFWLAIIVTIICKLIFFGSIPPYNILACMSLLPVGNITYPLGIEWTLIYEVFFYFVCALFTFQSTREYFVWFITLWTAIVIAAIYNGFNTPMLPTLWTIFFAYYNLFFIAGAISYFVIKNKILLNHIYCIFLLFLLGAVTIPIFYYANIGKVTILFLALGIGAIIYSTILSDRYLNTSNKTFKFFEKLGDNSYGLYLIHVPIITITVSIWLNIFKMPCVSLQAAILILILTFSIGWYFGEIDARLHPILKKKLTQILDNTKV